MSTKRVMVYVQHLLGIGHLKRAVTLAGAMSRQGLAVTLVSGGPPVEGMDIGAGRWLQLPPARAADLSFKSLIDVDGRPVDDAWKQRRRDMLLDAWHRIDPHAIVIELFPFGRRQMRFELLPLLDAASSAVRRPVIVSSVRDVLGGGQKDPTRQDRMLELFERYFDHLLVHGDPALIPFDTTFMHAARLGNKLHYTGYVVDRQTPTDGIALARHDEVIVSVGGGAVGERLLETALLARPLCLLRENRWRLLAGTQVNDAALARLRDLARASGTVPAEVERNRADFRQLLSCGRMSISQGGYNTMMDLLQAKIPSVVVPFAGGAETEQTLRARLLAERGWIELLEESDLSATTLARAIDCAAQRPQQRRHAIASNGAHRAAELVAQWTAQLPW
ncbi:MAG: glycosyltransferase [Burkholderiaceae bacterium]